MSEIYDIRNLVNQTLSGINLADSNKAYSVLDGWKKVLLRIKSNKNPYEGQNLAEHSKVVDFKNGILIIEVEHPGWMELLQLHKKFILKGLNLDMPSLKIKNLGFKLKQKNDDFFNNKFSDEETISKFQKKIEDEEKLINSSLNFNSNVNLSSTSKSKKIEQKKELPEELKSIFDILKNDMLTNQEK